MVQKCLVGNGGGKTPTLDNLAVTGKTLLQHLTTQGASWTATEDCIMCGSIVSPAQYNAIIYLNNVSTWFSAAGHSSKIGYTAASQATPDTYGMFIPKGVTVSTRASYGTYDIYFYSLT